MLFVRGIAQWTTLRGKIFSKSAFGQKTVHGRVVYPLQDQPVTSQLTWSYLLSGLIFCQYYRNNYPYYSQVFFYPWQADFPGLISTMALSKPGGLISTTALNKPDSFKRGDLLIV